MSRSVPDSDFDVAGLLRGMTINVYQAKSYPNRPGKWHAHVSGGHLTEQELLTAGERGTFDPTRSEWWVGVGYVDSEQEAREKGCAVIGSVLGQRLARALGPQVIPAQEIPSTKRAVL